MNYETFWREMIIDITTDKEFHILPESYQKMFHAIYSEGFLKIFPESIMQERKISQAEFIKIWKQAKKMPRGEQFVRVNYNQTTRNSSYILALIRHYLGGEQIE